MRVFPTLDTKWGIFIWVYASKCWNMGLWTLRLRGFGPLDTKCLLAKAETRQRPEPEGLWLDYDYIQLSPISGFLPKTGLFSGDINKKTKIQGV